MALNPVIKFTTLFGLLAVELAVKLTLTRVRYGQLDAGDRVLCRGYLLRMEIILRYADRSAESSRGQAA